MIRSGGLFYHLRALRFRQLFWDQHREGVRKFLSEWNPQSKKLVLIGPSGGYSFPDGWFSKFESITAFEPDFMARIIFEKRHSIQPKWIKTGFPFQDFSALKEIPMQGSAILFCNILGQISIRNPSRFQSMMVHHLAGREWASYHDALSGEGIEFDLEDLRPGRASSHEMEKWIYVKNPKIREVSVNSHPAPDLFRGIEGLEFRYWQWRILPHFTHLIEGVYPKARLNSI